MKWKFWSKKPKSSPPPVINETWRVGDMAEAIDHLYRLDTKGRPIDKAISKGTRSLVLGVQVVVSAAYRQPILGLKIIGHTGWANAQCFRKIVLTDTSADRMVSKDTPLVLDEPLL